MPTFHYSTSHYSTSRYSTSRYSTSRDAISHDATAPNQLQSKQIAVHIEQDADGYEVSIGDKTYRVVQHKQTAHSSHFSMDGQQAQVHLAADSPLDQHLLWFAGQEWRLEKIDPRRKNRRGSSLADSGALTASMPGLVQAVLAEEGTSVKQGETLLILEAMKMETRIIAPKDGVVLSLGCAVGDIVERGQTLVMLA